MNGWAIISRPYGTASLGRFRDPAMNGWAIISRPYGTFSTGALGSVEQVLVVP